MIFRVCLMLGSFDPVHNGHLMVAQEILCETNCNQVWMVCSPQNPQKEIIKTSYQDRLKMLKLSISNMSDVVCDDIESKIIPPYYTIKTLDYIKNLYQNFEFWIALGSDCLENINTWNDSERLLMENNYILFPRYGKLFTDKMSKTIKQMKSCQFINVPGIELSSTIIRKRVADKKDIRFYVPDSVRKYIIKKKLYT